MREWIGEPRTGDVRAEPVPNKQDAKVLDKAQTVHTGIRLPADLKTRFAIKLATEDRFMNRVLETLVRGYVNPPLVAQVRRTPIGWAEPDLAKLRARSAGKTVIEMQFTQAEIRG